MRSEAFARLESIAPKPTGKSPLVPPPPNESYFYATSRLCSFYPVINGNNATFLEEDFAPLIDSGNTETAAIGKPASLWHMRASPVQKVVGSIQAQQVIPGVGVDITTRIDRRMAAVHGLSPEDFGAGTEYSCVSQEVYCDRARSRYIIMQDEAHADDLTKQRVMSAEEAASAGVTRTSPADTSPYMYQGKYRVVELCKPLWCTGVTFLDDPADPTAQVFELAAARELTPEEKAALSEDTVPTLWAGDGGMGDIHNMHGDTEYSELDSSARTNLPDSAFAAVYTDTDGHGPIRKLPLYKSADAVKSGKPDPGLVKAAAAALSSAGFRGERVQVPDHVHAEARNKVRAAHDKVFPKGDKQVTAEEKAALTDPLDLEINSLKTRIAEETAAKNDATTAKDALQTQITDLQAVVTAKNEEIATLKTTIADREAEEKAAKRLAELVAIDGYVPGTDEEQAALVTSLKAESDDSFKIRKQGIEIGLLRSGKSAKTETAEETAARKTREAEEEAAREAGLDILPVFDPKSDKNDLTAFM